MSHYATSLYTYAENGFVQTLVVRHYSRSVPLFLRGYFGPSYDLGDLRALVESGGRDQAQVPA